MATVYYSYVIRFILCQCDVVSRYSVLVFPLALMRPEVSEDIDPPNLAGRTVFWGFSSCSVASFSARYHTPRFFASDVLVACRQVSTVQPMSSSSHANRVHSTRCSSCAMTSCSFDQPCAAPFTDHVYDAHALEMVLTNVDMHLSIYQVQLVQIQTNVER